MPNTREMELWRLVNKTFQKSIEKFGDIFAKDVTRDLLDNGVTVQEWTSVKDRLPEEGETVLVFGYWHEKFQPLMCYLSPHRKGEWFTSVAGQQVYTVTHWMPLPDMPKEEK